MHETPWSDPPYGSLISNAVANEIVSFVENPRRMPIKFPTEFTMKLVAAQPPLFRSEACEQA